MFEAKVYIEILVNNYCRYKQKKRIKSTQYFVLYSLVIFIENKKKTFCNKLNFYF